MTTGLGIAPSQRPVDSVAVKGLYNEAIAQERQWALATTCAPITQMGAHEGTYPTDSTWRGVDLSTDANIASEVALSATNYAPLQVDYSSNSFRCARYQLGQFDLPDREVAKLLTDNGIDVESHVSRLLAQRGAALHYYQVFGGFRFGVIMIRIAQQLAEYGIMDADASRAFELNNTVTRLLARTLDLPAPGQATGGFEA